MTQPNGNDLGSIGETATSPESHPAVPGGAATFAARVGAPPLPHEHGAWVMLIAPMLVALAAAPQPSGGRAALAAIAVIGAFLAREPADLLIRGRGKPGTLFWLAAYLAVALAGALPLAFVTPGMALPVIGAVAAGLFAVHAALLAWPARRRLDRTQAGEGLAVVGLTLSAPLAYAAQTGRLDGLAVCLWAACALYFGGGVFHVKMLLSAVKGRSALTAVDRLRLGRFNLAYHAAMLLIVIWAAPKAGPVGGALALAAYAPAILRAAWGTARLSRTLPPLKRVGVLETLYALWFGGAFAAALRLG